MGNNSSNNWSCSSGWAKQDDPKAESDGPARMSSRTNNNSDMFSSNHALSGETIYIDEKDYEHLSKPDRREKLQQMREANPSCEVIMMMTLSGDSDDKKEKKIEAEDSDPIDEEVPKKEKSIGRRKSSSLTKERK